MSIDHAFNGNDYGPTQGQNKPIRTRAPNAWPCNASKFPVVLYIFLITRSSAATVTCIVP